MQLVIRVIDKYEGTDPHRQAKSTERGDVIEVVEDDHQWGRLDLTNPSWVIIRCDITRAEADAMKVGESPEADTQTSRIRAFRVDLDELISLGYVGIPTKQQARDVRDRYEAQSAQRGIGRSAAKHDPLNARPVAVVDVGPAHLLAAKKRKPPVQDPHVIG
jgi:hypothetical protein